MAFEASPVDQASPILHAPIVASGEWSSRILLINPGDAIATVRVEYRANADASGDGCLDAAIRQQTASIPPMGTRVVDQHPRWGASLGTSCWASASIHADRDLLGSVLLLQADQRASAAYRLKRADEAGHQFAHLPIRHRYTSSQFDTTVVVHNPGARDVEVGLEILDHMGDRVDCPGCSVQVPAGGSRAWWSSEVDGLRQRDNFWGYGQVLADGPVLVNVLDHSPSGRYDAVI